MSSSLPALLLILGVSGAAWAADPPASEGQAELIVPSVADFYLDTAPARQATVPAALKSILGGRQLDGRRPGESSKSPLKVRLGRTPLAGRSPGDVPPLYGEVGVDLDSGAGLSLVPSYRVVLPDEHETAESEASAAQIVKLGARIRF